MATVTVNVTNTDETQSLRNTWKATKYMLAFIFIYFRERKEVISLT